MKHNNQHSSHRTLASLRALYVAVCLLALAPMFAMAQSHGYLGGTLGSAQLDDDELPANANLDDSSWALGVYGGYQFGRYFAVEGAAKWLGRYASDISTQRYAVLTGSAVGILPFGQSGFDVYGQLGLGGVAMWGPDYDEDELEIDGDVNVSKSSYGPAFHAGLGARYTPPSVPGLTVRLGYEHFFYRLRYSVLTVRSDDNFTVEVDDEDIQQSIGSFLIGAHYNF
jgi:hypothetical protein